MGAIQHRPGRTKPWRARWRDPAGVQRSASFARKADAQRFLTSTEADKLRGSYVDPNAGKVVFAAFAERWVDGLTVDAKTREGVASHLKAHLLPAFGHLELRAVKPSTVQAWLGGASRSHAPGYVRLLLSTLSAVLGAATDDGVIARNPCRSRSVQAPSPSREQVVPWTVEQVAAVEEALPARYAAAATVAAGCGLRQGEAFGLAVGDVDFLRRRVLVRQQVKHVTGGTVFAPPKRGKTRTVPLPASVAEALAEHLRVHPRRRSRCRGARRTASPARRRSCSPTRRAAR